VEAQQIIKEELRLEQKGNYGELEFSDCLSYILDYTSAQNKEGVKLK